jgi:hypothetical protein
MRTFSGKFYFDQISLIASHMEFLLQKAYFAVEETYLNYAQINLACLLW